MKTLKKAIINEKLGKKKVLKNCDMKEIKRKRILDPFNVTYIWIKKKGTVIHGSIMSKYDNWD